VLHWANKNPCGICHRTQSKTLQERETSTLLFVVETLPLKLENVPK
jgi:hypothetical protein